MLAGLYSVTNYKSPFLPRSERGNLSQGEIKIRILGYLYNKGEIGANAYTIEHRANIRSPVSENFWKICARYPY